MKGIMYVIGEITIAILILYICCKGAKYSLKLILTFNAINILVAILIIFILLCIIYRLYIYIEQNA